MNDAIIKSGLIPDSDMPFVKALLSWKPRERLKQSGWTAPGVPKTRTLANGEPNQTRPTPDPNEHPAERTFASQNRRMLVEGVVPPTGLEPVTPALRIGRGYWL